MVRSRMKSCWRRPSAGKRDKLLIATKVGSEVSDSGERGAVNGTPAYIKKAIDRSLKHLNTGPCRPLLPAPDRPECADRGVDRGAEDLVTAGKVRYIGVSEAAPATIRRAHAVHPLTAVQTEYSLFERSPETNDVLKTVRELGIGFVSYSPLGRGFLTGQVSTASLDTSDFRKMDPALVGREYRPERADRRAHPRRGSRQGRDARADRPGVDHRAGHDADPGHAADQISRGECRGRRHYTERRRSGGRSTRRRQLARRWASATRLPPCPRSTAELHKKRSARHWGE